mgnify:CR=1 FL=1
MAEVRGLEERIHVAERDLVALRHDLLSAEEEMARLQRKQAVLDTERGQAEQERGAAAVRLAEIEQALGTAEHDRDEGSRRLAAADQRPSRKRARPARRPRSAPPRPKSVLAALARAAAATEAECRRLSRTTAISLGRIAAAEQRGAEMDARREELRAEMAEAERLLTESLAARERVAGEARGGRGPRARPAQRAGGGAKPASRSAAASAICCATRSASWRCRRPAPDSDLDHLGRECHQAVAMMAAEAAALITEEDRAQDLVRARGPGAGDAGSGSTAWAPSTCSPVRAVPGAGGALDVS